MDVVGNRLEDVQGEVFEVGTRLTGFVDDMRQRFRVMSEQAN
jgi:hypothetical protein